MRNLVLFESYVEILQEGKKEKKDQKWVTKKGKLRKALGVAKKGEVDMETIDAKIEELKKKAEDTEKIEKEESEIVEKNEKSKLSKKEAKLLRRLEIAKELKSNLG
jgi:thiamine biosynthesis lipoprotein ApbE